MTRRLFLAAALAAALAIAGCGSEPPPRLAKVTVEAATPTPGPALAAAKAHASERPGIPVRIEIPAIGVRAPVIKLGLDKDGSLEVPRRWGDTGWWSGGSRPGEAGPAVIAGHVDSKSGPAVFYRLGQLRRGDRIRVLRRDGTAATFVVRRLERHPKDSFPTAEVYGPTRGPALRLITCGGAFNSSSGHYIDNTIVFADPVGGR
jgi:sortase (surface protein transpeptidase)